MVNTRYILIILFSFYVCLPIGSNSNLLNLSVSEIEVDTFAPPIFALADERSTFVSHYLFNLREAQNVKLFSKSKKPIVIVKKPRVLVSNKVHSVVQDKKIKLSGTIDFDNNLSIISNKTSMNILRVVNGKKFEKASYNLYNGTFNVLVDKLKGKLKASLRSDGYLLGLGEINLSKLKNTNNLRLRIKPVKFTVAGNVFSAYDKKKK